MSAFDDVNLEDAARSFDHHHRAESRDALLSGLYTEKLARSLATPRSILAHVRLRRVLVISLAVASAVSLLAVSSVTVFRGRAAVGDPTNPPIPSPRPAGDAALVPEPPELEEDEPEVYSPYVNGPPTARFRDNLRNDTKYITSWVSAGWTNDVMTYANLIYLGSITERVPLVGMFTPSHVGGDAGSLAFGDVFDVPRFIAESGIDIVEWREVKDPASEALDDLGCWNVWESVQYNEAYPRHSWVPLHLGLDLSYTKTPAWIKLVPDYPHDQGATFWSLARLGFPEERAQHLGQGAPSPAHGASLDPDEQVLCFDFLYYVWAQQSWEWDKEYSPAWRYVARHLHWTPEIEGLTALYLRRAFHLPRSAPVPPYIAVHVRHGDFGGWCWDAEAPEDCFAPLSAIARRVREVRDELRERRGVDIPAGRVIVTSDEKDEDWWGAVAALGWVKIDHGVLQTEERYGRWYPVLLDAALQGAALGFVGTDRSTFSGLSARRVVDWNGGASRMVLWGRRGADDH